MVSEFRLPLYNYITTFIEVPYHPNEQVFFPLHKETSKNPENILGLKNPENILGLKHKQLQQILENKLFRSQEKQYDISLLNATIDWFENYSNNFFQENNIDPNLNLESSLIIIQDKKSYTIISIDSYFELKMQIQISALKDIPEKEQKRWTGRYSNMFVNETIDKTPFHASKKCRVFTDLEKRVKNTLIKINKKFQVLPKTFEP